MNLVQIGNTIVNLEQVAMVNPNYKWVEHIYADVSSDGEAHHIHHEGVLIKFADGSKHIIADEEEGALFVEYVASMAAFIGEVAE
jgi:hypothetical protein